MKENWPVLVWWGLVTFVTNVPTLSAWTLPNLSSSEWAAWVQAVGSIAAIIASVLLALLLPQYQQAKAHEALQARMVLAILNSSDELHGFVAAAQQILKSGKVNNGTYPHIASGVRAHQNDLSVISPIDLPSSARIHLIAARASADIILTLLDYAHQELGHKRHVRPDFFDDVVGSTAAEARKIRDYVAARPIGKTPLIGFH